MAVILRMTSPVFRPQHLHTADLHFAVHGPATVYRKIRATVWETVPTHLPKGTVVLCATAAALVQSSTLANPRAASRMLQDRPDVVASVIESSNWTYMAGTTPGNETPQGSWDHRTILPGSRYWRPNMPCSLR
ncbi:hypothetical protein PUNSTDRAFT_123213 [Punctularia strigosozonata HHB-11173 SS5]|uniref:Uncharacterized protein n=1 Tax=Punctularia strigosozonata (strain HHB-11173) TaxID=741275 RepID=R7S1G5_PUNST|nr:uncharacterized protein PUNSTDRAFT_123213 [Punctularia strigosozonata HHB-11173 SS5]EIN03622.1 hypothetical protein PUNSTDRAFT_123213 [Punctularia strigosozonata HHB-11173 SS5]